MAKTVLVGKEKERQLKDQQKIAKQKTKKKRRSPARYFKDMWSEMKKVTWPTKKDLITYTLAVIAFILIMATITGLFDLGLGKLFHLVTSGTTPAA